MRFRILICVLIFMTGCQAILYVTASDFEDIALGMSKKQVIEILGSPVSVSADESKGEEYLIYKRIKHVTAMWFRTYSVTLRNDQVVKYGEQYGGRRNYFKAVELYRQACDGQDALGCNNLGASYEFGAGVRQSREDALTFYGKACDLKEELGCTNYARLKTGKR